MNAIVLTRPDLTVSDLKSSTLSPCFDRDMQSDASPDRVQL